VLASLVNELVRWLRSPEVHITVSPAEDVQRLESEVERLQSQVDDLMVQLQRVQMLYAQECTVNMSLQDQLRAAGVKLRR